MSRNRRLGSVLAAVGLAVPPVTTVVLLHTVRWRGIWTGDAWARPVLVSHLFSVAAAGVGGAVLVRRPAMRRLGTGAIALSLIFGVWWFEALHRDPSGWRYLFPTTLVYLLRPLLFWLVLAYPVGRLDRVGRRLWWLFVVGTACEFIWDNLVDLGDAWPHDPLAVWKQAAWTFLIHSAWWDVAGLLMALAVLVAVWRRNLRWTGNRALVRPAWWAAVVAAGGDLVLMGSGPVRDLMFHGGRLTPFGAVIQSIDLGRWGLVVAILAVGSRKMVTHDAASPVELGSMRPSDDVAAVLHPTPEGWVDRDGLLVASGDLPAAEFTTILRRGRPIAAVRRDAASTVHPAVADSVSAVVALQLANSRALALARAREAQIRRLGRAVLDAEDDRRRALERDIHDGAQQALVGLVIEAALTARSDDPGARLQLAQRIDDVGAELETLAAGRAPALLVTRGIADALSVLASTSPLPVAAVIDLCTDVSPEVSGALWFCASDALANALKHSGASQLTIELECTESEAVLTITDDGAGGMSAPPASLVTRAASCGGEIEITSPPGRGTAVRVVVPQRIEVMS